MTRTERDRIQPYITKDGSEIRELMHPKVHGNRNQSLAEAVVTPGSRTLAHRHVRSEEIYHVLEGTGIMTLGGEEVAVAGGDTVLISPGTEHWLANTGPTPLRVLCACAPAYTHEDTELTGASGQYVG